MTNFTAEDALHIYSYASEKAISAFCFVMTATETGFVLGKSRLAPANTTIQRLELCAAVLATEVAEIISEHLDYPMERFIFNSDSRVVLGYLNNQSRRFYTYVANRVQIILKRTNVHQWNYVHTSNNPADLATRCATPAKKLDANMWITGPNTLPNETRCPDTFTLVDEDKDSKIRPFVKVSKTDINRDITETFEKFFSWKSLIKVESLTDKKRVGSKSSIALLNPFLDKNGTLRMGWRIHKATFNTDFKHPILVPRKSHIAGLLVNNFHVLVHHQGTLYTEAALRNHGYWIVGVKRLVSSIIYQCVTCRRLRGNLVNQRIANLPEDRLTPGPPFTYVGVDTFGPWPVVTRRTRGGVAESKRWAIIFVCLFTGAAHIEVIEDMSSSAFINALRRFISVRGPVKEF
ncbi:uncharacterized protein LOC127837378 [Dreissena polymorpha]|uniref:uncharacterized protein LOC127837378 n=1 Tax=Dreissena polymorpha TaxID=45954 RepID=UPI002264EB8D|nr:uncharacterized protein LOC127837378 [Dreissena polymorpha]